MIIGIDLDNTIISYDVAFLTVGKKLGLLPTYFCGSKKQIKSFLLESPDGQFNWEKLQGKVYGSEIESATLFPSVRESLAQFCADKRVEIYIISHKTELAHHDENHTNIREAATVFLTKCGILHHDMLTKNNIYFCNTLEQKVRTIAELKCDVFIDDLEIVLSHHLFPKNCKAILFGASSETHQAIFDWQDIKNVVDTYYARG